jgi:hypothetical protein
MGVFDLPTDDALGESSAAPEGIAPEDVPKFGTPGEIGDIDPPIPTAPLITSPTIEHIREETGATDEARGIPDFDTAVGYEMGESNVTWNLADMYHNRELGTERDPNWVWADQDYAGLVSTWGIEPHHREAFLDHVGKAVSAEHANILARQFNNTVEKRAQLEKLSFGERAGTLAVAIASDPVMTIATGGPIAAIRGVVKGGAVLGAAAGAGQAVISLNNPIQDETEVFFAAAGGAAIGSLGNLILGRLGGKEAAEFAAQHERIARQGEALTSDFTGGKAAALGRGDDLTPPPAGKDTSVGAAEDLERGVESERGTLGAIFDDVEAENGVALKAPTPVPGLRNLWFLRTVQDRGLNSKSGEVRAVTQKGFREDVGAIQTNGAITEIEAKTNEAAILADTAKEYFGSFNAWARRLNKPRNAETQAEFFEAVGVAQRRGGSVDPDVARAVAATNESYARALPMGKAAGTFDEAVQASDTHLTRVYHSGKIRAARDLHGDNKFNELIYTSLRSGLSKAGVKISDELLEKWAKGLSKNIKDRADGMSETSYGLPVHDQALLDETLTAFGMARRDIDAIKDELKLTGTAGDGKIARGKGRVQLDETVGVSSRAGGLTLEDILENDVRKIMPVYAKQVGADIAFRKTLGVPATEAGVSRLAGDIKRASLDAGDKEGVHQGLEAGLRDLAGLRRKGLDPDAFLPRASSTLRNGAFAVFGPLFGTASLAEFGAVMGKLGILGTLKALPALRKFRRDAISGKLDLEFVDHLEGYNGLGMDRLMRPHSLRGTKFDAAKEDLVNAKNPIERAAVAARNFTVKYSGLEWVTEWQRQQVPILILSEIEAVLMRGKKLTRARRMRMAQMGYDDKGLKELGAQLEKHGIDISGSVRKIRRTDLEAWAAASPKTHNKFIQAVLREGERTIIETSTGRTPAWMSDGFGQVLGQFMGFTVNSYNTHLLRGLNMFDHQVMMNLMTSTIITGTAGTAINYARYFNDPKMLREKMTIEEMAKWGFARNTFGGIPSMAVDSILGLSSNEGFFNSRYSDLSSTPGIDSSPSIAFFQRLFLIGKRFAAIAQGKPITGDDIGAVMNVTPLTVLPSAKKAAKEFATKTFGIPSKDPRK